MRAGMAGRNAGRAMSFAAKRCRSRAMALGELGRSAASARRARSCRHAQGHRCGLQPRPVNRSGFSERSHRQQRPVRSVCAVPASSRGNNWISRAAVDRHVTGVRIIGDRHRPLEPREQLHGVEPLASRQAVGVEARDVEHVAWGAAWPWDVKMLNDAIVCITFAYQEMCGGPHL
jgi:hypothetical protein